MDTGSPPKIGQATARVYIWSDLAFAGVEDTGYAGELARMICERLEVVCLDDDGVASSLELTLYLTRYLLLFSYAVRVVYTLAT